MSLDELHWDQLWAAWGFLGVAGLLLMYGALAWWKRSVAKRLGDARLIREMASSTSVVRQRLKAGLVLLAAVFIVVALMRPKYGERAGAVTNTGIDVAVVLDVSKSMLVRDVVPNRLTGAKLEINGLLDRLQGGRVALIPFAGIPFVQCPLTTDFQVIRTYLEDLRVADMPVGGTAVARALQLSIDVLKGDDGKDDQDAAADARKDEDGSEEIIRQFQGSKYKAIVLFTDGEDHEGEVEAIAQAAADEGIQILTVGVGTGSGNVVPILTEDGSEIGYLKAADGKTPLISGLNESLLRQVAETTSGEYFHFGARSIIEPLYGAIDVLEKQEYTARYAKLGEDRFQLVLWPAVLLLLLELFIGDRRRRKRRARLTAGKTRVATAALAAFALLFVGAADTRAEPPPETPAGLFDTTNGDIDEGNTAFEAGELDRALGHYEDARASIPENAILHYNMGLLRLALGKWEDAVDSLERSQEAPPGWLRLPAKYALGTAHAEWGKALEKDAESSADALEHWEKAADAFESVLLDDPSHEEARWNLELALLRVDPPCRMRNDDHEPNNSPEEAKPLELSMDQEKGLAEAKLPITLCPEDIDFFGLKLGPGDRLEVSVERTDPSSVDYPLPLTLTAVTDDGQQFEAAAEDPESDAPKNVSVPMFEAQKETVVGLRIRGSDLDEMTAQLAVTVRPPCAAFEDQMEENDTPRQAKSVPQEETTNLRICPDDDDWFEVFLGEGDSVFAYATAQGDLTEGFDLSLHAEDGRKLASSGANDGTRIAALLEPGAGRYLIRVSGGDTAEANYELTWKVLPPCPEGNDLLEPNDSANAAREVSELAKAAPKMPAPAPGGTGGGPGGMGGAGGGQGQPAPTVALLRICAGDEDFFRVRIKPEEPQIAQIVFDHAKGDLSLGLLDAEGETEISVSDASTPEKSAEGVAFPEVEEETDYLLRIRGSGDDENFYVLRIQPPPPPGDQPQENPDQGEDEQEQNEDEQEQEQQEEDQAQNDEQEDEKEQEPQPEEQKDPVQEAMEQMDQNPENLEAREALMRSPLRNLDPEKDW